MLRGGAGPVTHGRLTEELLRALRVNPNPSLIQYNVYAYAGTCVCLDGIMSGHAVLFS